MGDYTPTGHNADKLIAILDDPSKEGEILTYVSLLDGREVAKRLSALTGRKFRVQKETNFLQALAHLLGNNWTWTETKYDENTFVLRYKYCDSRFSNNPENRCGSYALRLVEDK
ncbi:hypothetical protein A2282_06280 [candidate division WOR-1 bacterium RIFOXYA12_FULL_36_13]|nr:MAG: hypothetical protein A2282_06280 [candidate division WOR-1 bacterium RIFOXYA12_FULL_36_13]